MPDVNITCVQCNTDFVFSEKDQEFFYQRNMMPPQRCTNCRGKKSAKKEKSGGRFEIVCDHCGRHDSVPFQPKVGRSVLCKDCYMASQTRSRSA